MLCGYFSRNLVFLLTVGLVLSTVALAKDDKKEEAVKPSMKEMTSQKTSEAVAAQIPDSGSFDSINVHSVGFGLGQTKLDGDFSNHGADSITPSFFYNYSASHSFDLLLELHSSKHTYRGESVRLTALPIWVKAKIMQYDAFTPYIMGGLGFYHPSATRYINNEKVDSQNSVTLGLNVGAGAELRLNRHFSVGVIGAYYDPFDVKQNAGGPVSGRYYKLLITGFYHF